MAKLLLDKGAAVDVVSKLLGATALILAAPLSSSSFATASWPCCAAMIRAVWPS